VHEAMKVEVKVCDKEWTRLKTIFQAMTFWGYFWGINEKSY
jgi:hypothetical protein